MKLYKGVDWPSYVKLRNKQKKDGVSEDIYNDLDLLDLEESVDVNKVEGELKDEEDKPNENEDLDESERNEALKS